MRRVMQALVAALALTGVPSLAHADGFISPLVGVNFLNDSGKGRANFGVGLGWMGAGIAGVELDVGYAPNFFGSDGGFGENHVLTAMGNLLIGVPVGGTHGKGLRPYGTIGVGLVRTQVTGTPTAGGVPKINDNDFGISGGAGVMGFLSEHVGLRGDLRYFRNFRETPPDTLQFGAFHFWRASFGVVLRP